MQRAPNQTGSDRGQATVLLALVIAATMLLGLGLWLVAEAMLHRANARNAADAIALAAVVDQADGEALAEWYASRGIVIEQVGPSTIVRSGPSQAGARASIGESTVATAPALRAIIARAEQILDLEFPDLRWHELSVLVPLAWAPDLASVASELGLCDRGSADPASPEWVEFALCEAG